VFGLPDIDDLPFSVLVEIHSGLNGKGTDFGEEVHLPANSRDMPK
jgi:hypothetical protein